MVADNRFLHHIASVGRSTIATQPTVMVEPLSAEEAKDLLGRVELSGFASSNHASPGYTLPPNCFIVV